VPEMGKRHPYLVRYAEKRVQRLGLEVHLNTVLQAATVEEAVLRSGERIPTRTIITCTGMKSSPLLDQFPYERDTRGRLVTDQFCRSRRSQHRARRRLRSRPAPRGSRLSAPGALRAKSRRQHWNEYSACRRREAAETVFLQWARRGLYARTPLRHRTHEGRSCGWPPGLGRLALHRTHHVRSQLDAAGWGGCSVGAGP